MVSVLESEVGVAGRLADARDEDRIADALRATLKLESPWRQRSEALAGTLASRWRRPLRLDVQRIFSLCPPDSPRGEAFFRLTEALPRVGDRAGRLSLIREFLPALGRQPITGIFLPVVARAIEIIGGQFIYGRTIGDAIEHARRDSMRDSATCFSFDMLGEGARTEADASLNRRRYLAAISAVSRFAARQDRCHRNEPGISVKLSSIHARYDAASYPQVKEELLEHLRAMCRAAAAAHMGLTIDAEECERASLQLDIVTELSHDPQLIKWDGLGLAVQAYRRDAMSTLDAVVRLARARIASGGAKLCVRLVKGAYWDAEVKRAQELGLGQYPVFTDKRTTDLSYVACANRLLDRLDVLYPQFASHNPITLGCILALAEARGHLPAAQNPPFECQRLHGMGESLHRALRRGFPLLPVRIYAPVGGRQDLLAYLVRRLLENGSSTSYLRRVARGDVQGPMNEAFEYLSHAARARPLSLPTELLMPDRRLSLGRDLGDLANLNFMAMAVARQPRNWTAAPLVSGRSAIGPARTVAAPAAPDLPIGEVFDATPEVADKAIEQAYAARRSWASTDVEERAAALERLGELIEQDMIRLSALCVYEAGKTLADAVADVREAVDFCRYYAQEGRRIFKRPVELPGIVGETNELSMHGRGVFACISPWNFPVAIFTGQVAAALVAGNTVVAKPAEQTSLTAYRIAELILQAKVPPGAFQFIPGSGHTIGERIVSDRRISGVAFTGSNRAAGRIQQLLLERGGAIVPFIAETGGVNAMIVDSTALPEQVVDAVVASAFRSAGQRCSSLRVLYLQDEAAPAILAMLRGAMASLRLGDPSEPQTDIGPVIDQAAQVALSNYIERLRGRASLIGEVSAVPSCGYFVPPVAFEVGSIRDVPEEQFGPILHVARYAAKDLDHVIDDINSMGYGLTLGVHTRIDGRARYIGSKAAVGNIYVNRNMIGAVVGMQPFGGEGLSGTGPKAGGPHYLARFATERVYTVNTAAAGGDLRLMTGRPAL